MDNGDEIDATLMQVSTSLFRRRLILNHTIARRMLFLPPNAFQQIGLASTVTLLSSSLSLPCYPSPNFTSDLIGIKISVLFLVV